MAVCVRSVSLNVVSLLTNCDIYFRDIENRDQIIIHVEQDEVDVRT